MKRRRPLGLLAELLGSGGIEVRTPPDAPRLRTVLQPHGATLHFIATSAVDDQALQEQHADAVDAEVKMLAASNRIEQWRSRLEQLGWVTTVVSSGWWATDHDDLEALVTAAASALITAALRWLVPQVIRWVLGRMIRRAIQRAAAEAG